MFGIPFLTPQILGAIGIALLASFGGAFAEHKLDAIPLAQAKAETASAKADLAGYRATVAANIANANAKALSEKSASDARINALQAQLAQNQKDADARSKALLAALAKAQPGDVRPIGVFARAYYDGLRSGISTPAANHP